MKALNWMALILLVSPLVANAQAWEKGNANLDLGLGIASYNTTVSYTFTVNGDEVTLSEEDNSSSFYLPISFEYGIGQKIGIGAEFAYSNYFIDDEDTTNVSETVKGIDFGILLNYHLLDSDIVRE